VAYATAEDVAARLGRDLDGGETLLVNTRLEDAELLIRTRIDDLDDRVLASATYEKLVVMIESEMVLRLVRNPEGYSQESDGNYSYAIYQQVASGRLEVLPEEWELLGGNDSNMFQIVPVLPTPWTAEGAALVPFAPVGQPWDWS